ncbi:hypothetical protein [Clostridium sp. UBA6640]|uniref:hypothetical protein n=1 Tax=Clostridium sp. UBA6640 TaxID=1946370 RepID=UPI0025BF48FB|nr:hypothetical protein [Clostridium sp. UBA6640]
MKITIKKLCIFVPIIVILIFVFVSILTPKAKYMTGKDTVAYFGKDCRYQILVTPHDRRKEYSLMDEEIQRDIDRNITKYIDLKEMKTAFIVGQESFKDVYIVLDYENNKIERFNDLSEMNTIYRNTFTEKDFKIIKAAHK